MHVDIHGEFIESRIYVQLVFLEYKRWFANVTQTIDYLLKIRFHITVTSTYISSPWCETFQHPSAWVPAPLCPVVLPLAILLIILFIHWLVIWQLGPLRLMSPKLKHLATSFICAWFRYWVNPGTSFHQEIWGVNPPVRQAFSSALRTRIIKTMPFKQNLIFYGDFLVVPYTCKILFSWREFYGIYENPASCQILIF